MFVVVRHVFTLVVALWAASCSAGSPVIPGDVLSRADIVSIKNDKNFFLYKFLDYETPIWMITGRRYSAHFLQDRNHYFSLDDVLHRVVTDSFAIRLQLERVYRGKMGIHAAIGQALPNISLLVGGGAPALSFGSAFANLFGFVLPHNWLQVASEQRIYKASKYLLMRAVLDEMLTAKLAYLEQHQAIQDLETISFYFIHLQMLVQDLPPGTLAADILHGRVGFEGNRMAQQREQTRLGFDRLSLLMALDKVDGQYGAGNINIADLREFPRHLDDPGQLGEVYRDKELFLEEVVRRSVELKIVKEFYNISKLNVGIVASGGTLFNIDNLEAQPQFAINLGYGTLPNILIAKSLTKTAKIEVQREFLNMLDNARRSFDHYTNALQSYTEAKRSMAENRLAFVKYLKQALPTKKGVQHILILLLAHQLDAERSLTRTLHKYLQAKAYIDRYLLVDRDGALAYLPSRGKIIEIFNEVKGRQLEEFRKEGYLDFQLEGVRKVENLSKILYEPHHYVELNSYSPAEIEAAVRRNIGGLLYSKPFFHKSKRFYRVLAQYLEEHNIELTNSESYILKKKAASWWDRHFRKKRVFRGDAFELFDFEHFRLPASELHRMRGSGPLS